MIALDDIALPSGIAWVDEFASNSVTQSSRRALDGSLVIYHAALTAGREITLESEADAGWITKTQADALAALAADPGRVMTLILRGASYSVMFRHHEPPAFDAKPLIVLANPKPGDFYRATIKLFTV